MVKVLVVNIQSQGGGAETVLKNLTGALGSGSGLQVDTFSKDAYSRQRPAGKLAGYFGFLRELRTRSARYDIVIAGVEGMPFLLCLAALCGRARPHLVLWLHCSPGDYLPFQTPKNRLAIQASLAAAGHILCAAPAEAARLAKRGKNAVFLPNIRRPAGEAQRASVPAQVLPRLAFVGSLAPLKQPLKTIELMQRLSASGRRDYHLDLFGTGALAAHASEQIRQNGLATCVTVHGFVPDPWRHIASGSILLLPSLTEAMPMVVLEAFEKGCVVIANTFTGHHFFDGHEGLFVAVDFTDIGRVAAAVDACRGWSAAELAARVAHSRAFVLTEFDNERSVTTMHRYLEKIVEA